MFKGMSDAERMRLVNGAHTGRSSSDDFDTSARFGTGAQIVKQGALGDSMFVLLQGQATVEIEFIGKVASYGPGDTFGELALQSDSSVHNSHGQRSATVTADTEVVALEISRENFESLVGKLGKNMASLKRNFHAASYGLGRRDYAALFRHLDKDNSGFLEEVEFRNAVRKEGKTDEAAMPERQLRVLYHIVDVDKDGIISEADFSAWLGVSSPEAYHAQLRQLEVQRDAVIAQAQEVLRSDHSTEASVTLKTLLKTKDGLQDEIAAKEEQIRLQRARDVKRVESFRTVAAAAQQAMVARSKLADDLLGEPTDDMVLKLKDINERCAEYQKLLEEKHRDLDKIIDPDLIRQAELAKTSSSVDEGDCVATDKRLAEYQRNTSMRRRTASVGDLHTAAAQQATQSAVDFLNSDGDEDGADPEMAAASAKQSGRNRRAKILKYLANPKLPFVGLNEDERIAVAGALQVQEYKAGEMIIEQDALGTDLFIIETGKADVTVRGDGKVGELENGSAFGELGLVSREPRRATITATAPTVCLTLTRFKFEQLVGNIEQHVLELRRRIHVAALSAPKSYKMMQKEEQVRSERVAEAKVGLVNLSQFTELLIAAEAPAAHARHSSTAGRIFEHILSHAATTRCNYLTLFHRFDRDASGGLDV